MTSTPEGARRPATLGVLSHYDAVVWYTGDDIITREPGFPGGTASRLAMDEMLQRPRLHERGRRSALHRQVRRHPVRGSGNQLYDPKGARCPAVDPAVAPRCLPSTARATSKRRARVLVRGSLLTNDDAGTDDDGNLFGVIGSNDSVQRPVVEFNGGESANNQDHSDIFIPTSAILPEETYPQFRSFASAQAATGRAGRSTRTAGRSTSTRTSRTCPTSG